MPLRPLQSVYGACLSSMVLSGLSVQPGVATPLTVPEVLTQTPEPQGDRANGMTATAVAGRSSISPAPTPPELLQQTVKALPIEFSPQSTVAQTLPADRPFQPTPDPNRDRLIQPIPDPVPVSPEQSQPVLPDVTPPDQPAPEQPPPTPEQPPITIPVSQIEVKGSTIFTEADFAPLTQPLVGQSVTLEQLRQVADAITQLYLDRGFITSRAVLVDQTIANGVVQIQVVEGSLERIEIEGNQRLNSAYIRRRIELGSKPPLNRDKLEDQLRLLKIDPLFTNVEASLRPGTGLGQSILVVRVTEANPLYGVVGVDNYSPPSVGSVRFGGAVGYRNLSGIGDDLLASYYRSTTGGSNNFDFIYRAPLNPMNGTIQLRAAPNNNRITDEDFKALDIRGSTGVYELSYRQPLIRTPRQEFALSLGFTYEDSQTFLFKDIGFPFGFGPDQDGKSRTRVLKLGQDYVRRDPQGAWALRSQFNLGLNILDATENDDPIPDGQFFSWQGQIQRVQRLGTNNLLIAALDLQLTPDSLLPSQQFVIGGGQSLRGYRQNARSGDNGFRFSVENRIAVMRDEAGDPVMQLAPFVDMGKVWNNSDNPNPQARQRFLIGAGLGFLWQPIPGLNIRLDYGIPFINLDDRGKDIQDDGFYFSVNYQF
ncbi:ShlB/FhaC/HecB family hemolysin secretion/activation protein [Pantanalinema rosaneae CENA516]|uniref:ShlB/FhaC/HecB family hemolysin secretion/activation protein n=1 Tax=Pantanalinema rosaneae TaxID=1620701 RepID=UPI003D6F7BC9